MDAIDKALEHLKLSDPKNISASAKLFGVDRSTLSRHYNDKSNPASMKHQNQQFLTPEQERQLVIYINTLTERGLLPTPAMVRNFAQNIAGKPPGKGWSHRFCIRNQDEIQCRYLKNIDLNRKKADNVESYKQYYDLLVEKMQQYRISPENQYNMDEKGFMLGVCGKQHRIFNKDSFEKGRTLGALQDGNREWITILATVCADGSYLPPGILYPSPSGEIQQPWVKENAKIGTKAHIAPSEIGWTSDSIAMHWLEEVFDRYTAPKAEYGLKTRLLYMDGHGSHLNMNFIKWCDDHNMFLAIYPPHSTHRLQPLDVSLFSPLAVQYSKQLTQHILETQGFATLTKKDFMGLFWPAFIDSFTTQNILSAFRKTGLHPLDSEPVLLALTQPSKTTTKPQDNEVDRPRSNQSNKSALSASDWRKIRAEFREIVRENKLEYTQQVDQMENTILALAAKCAILNNENKGLRKLAGNNKKQKKRKKGLFQQLRSLDGQGALFFSPQKVQAIHLQNQEQQEKAQSKGQKEFEKQQKTQKKQDQVQQRLANAQLRHQQQEQKKVEIATIKAQKEVVKNTSKANKQLGDEHKQSLKKPKRQNSLTIAPLPLPKFSEVAIDER